MSMDNVWSWLFLVSGGCRCFSSSSKRTFRSPSRMRGGYEKVQGPEQLYLCADKVTGAADTARCAGQGLGGTSETISYQASGVCQVDQEDPRQVHSVSKADPYGVAVTELHESADAAVPLPGCVLPGEALAWEKTSQWS